MISAVLTCKIDNEVNSIVMDTIDSDTINSSITLTEQPLISGDFIVDHLFKKPNTYSLNGVFGIGKKQGIVVNEGKLLLTEIQTLFERIKNEGIICSIVRVKVENNKIEEVRFLQRNNMILESIAWTENIDTLGFRFSFREVAFADTIEYDVDTDDANNPNVEELVQRSFSESLLSKQDCLKSILSFMYDNDIMSDTFWQSLIGNKSETFLALGIGVAVAYALGSLIVSCGASGPVGWIVGIVVVAIALIGVAIAKIVRRCRFKIKPFDKYNQKELTRWAKLMESMSNEIEAMSNYIQVYQPSSDKDQECILTIDGQVYVYAFRTNNVSLEKSLVLINGEDNEIGGLSNISQAPTNYGDCTTQNRLNSSDTNKDIYMHLIYTGENTPEEKAKYTNYYLTISSVKPEKFEEMMGEIIKNYLLK